MRGRFDENDSPLIRVKIWGSGAPREFEAILDTGNNGYFQLSYADVFPLGLTLSGVETTQRIDGTPVKHFVCKGNIECDGTAVETTVDIHENCLPIIGMRLLKIMGKKAIVDIRRGIVDVSES